MPLLALILAIIKIILDLVIYIIKRSNQKEVILHNAEGKSCLYLCDNICSNVIFKRKMSNGICPRQNCRGFNIDISINDKEITNSSVLLSIKKIIDMFPEFAATLLAINELLNK